MVLETVFPIKFADDLLQLLDLLLLPGSTRILKRILSKTNQNLSQVMCELETLRLATLGETLKSAPSKKDENSSRRSQERLRVRIISFKLFYSIA